MAALWPTNVTGGAHVQDGIVSYIPDCSDIHYSAISASGAAQYDITTVHYVVDELIPTMIPGFVFGGLALIACALFILWGLFHCCAACCRCCRRKRARARKPSGLVAQFASSEDVLPAAEAPAGPYDAKAEQPGGCCASPGPWRLLLLTLALAVLGVAIWGLIESIQSTNTTISTFWGLVDAVSFKVDNATAYLVTLNAQLVGLSGNATVLTSKAPVLTRALRSLNVSAADAAQIESAITSLPARVDRIARSVNSGRRTLEENVGETIHDIRDDWEDPTMEIEDTWRFIPIAGGWQGAATLFHMLFGVLIVLAVACCPLYWKLTWRRTAAWCTALLWLDVALLMLLGAGFLRGAYVGASDSCKYAETLAVEEANRTVEDPQQRQQVMSALAYYLGLRYIPVSQVVNELLGVPTHLLHSIVDGPEGRLLLTALGSPEAAAVAQAVGFTAHEATALRNISTLLPAISFTVAGLELQALKSSIDPLYHDVKIYICCTLGGEAYDVWLAWTIAGALGFALALVCTARLWQPCCCRRARKQAPAAVQLAHVTAEPAPPVVGAAPLEAGWGKMADQPPEQFIRA